MADVDEEEDEVVDVDRDGNCRFLLLSVVLLTTALFKLDCKSVTGRLTMRMLDRCWCSVNNGRCCDDDAGSIASRVSDIFRYTF